MLKKKISRITFGFVVAMFLASFWTAPVHAYGWGDLGGDIVGGVKSAGGAIKDFATEGLPKGIHDAFTGGGGSGDGVTSFVEFRGSLQPPSGEGLAPELTKVKTAREFILNITKFALGFLGLIAVVIIIYGGFLYVTSGGNDEQTGTGKKAVQYAVIGILLILGSFAIVNTLLLAPTGTDKPDGGERGAAEVVSKRAFNLAALEIRASTMNFMQLAQNFSAIAGILGDIRTLPGPQDVAEAKSVINGIGSAMNIIKSFSAPTDEAFAAADNVADQFVTVWSRKSEEDLWKILISDGIIKVPDIPDIKAPDLFGSFDFIPSAHATPRKSTLSPRSVSGGTPVSTSSCGSEATKGSFYCDGKGSFRQALKKVLDENFYNKNPHTKDFEAKVKQIKDRLDKVQKGLGPVGNAPAAETARTNLITKGITSESELQKVLDGIPYDWTIKQAFTDALTTLETSKNALTVNPDDAVSLRNAVTKLGLLYAVVQEIKFISVKINPSVQEGNAPLAVQFTSIGSLDPSGQTIEDSQHMWDLDGDGENTEINSLGCKEKGGASVTCVYPKAGTYRVNLRINPKSSDTQTASGVAIITVKVNPPASRINLEAETGGVRKTLHAFDNEGRLAAAASTYTITKEEGKNGVLYDASKTTDSTGSTDGIKFFQWNFGDASNPIVGPNSKIIDNPRKKYKDVGIFPLTLEITDKAGRKDRMIVNVTVASIAARVIAPILRGDINTAFIFDGTNSKSDTGPIESYEWKITDEKGSSVSGLKNNTTNSFRYQFKTAGKYTVSLKVADKAGNEATDQVEVRVESQKPKADFTIRGCGDPAELCLNPNHPSLVEFDASKSFDPDSGDKLSYKWEFPGLENRNDFEVTEGALENASADKTKTVKIKFFKTGTFQAKLTVEDQHQDPELRKKDVMQKDFTVSSAVDLEWARNMETAKNLEGTGGGAKAEITFLADMETPKTAEGDSVSYIIDFGDLGEKTEETLEDDVSTNSDLAQYKLEIQHNYTEAKSFVVTLTVKSRLFGESTIQKRIYIGSGDSPIPVIEISKQKELSTPEQIFFDPDAPIVVLNKVDKLKFDASRSLNSRGGTEGLRFSWNFGDGVTSTSAAPEHIFENVSPADPGYYEVILTVVEQSETGGELKTAEMKIKVNATAAKPTLHALSVVKASEGEETPLNFEITAEGADDADGRIKEFTFWYFDEDDAQRKLSVVTTNTDKTTLTIGTKGLAGEEKKYSFCVEMKDDENNIASCEELFPDKKTLPFAVVKNGPNQSPTVDITVDKTTLKVGESVAFSARAADVDGRVVKYVWDVLGDGFHNDSQTELSQITQKYDEKSPPSGYKVKVQVIDDKGASGYSNEIPIFVFLPGNPPAARFFPTPIGGTKISFDNLSTVAPGTQATLTKFSWDFDMDREFNTERGECSASVKARSELLCDHDTTNDPDSTEREPLFEYSSSGIHRVRLTVEDSNGQKGEIIQTVTVQRNATSPTSELQAELKSEPEYVLGNITDPATRQPKRVKQIRFTSNGDFATYYFGESRGDIFEYALDANIYFDSDGDGLRDNDKNFTTDDGSQTFRWRYSRDWCAQYNPATKWCTAVLTVYGRNAQGQVIPPATDEIYIMFDQTTGAASLFRQFGSGEGILLGIFGGVILALAGYFVIRATKKGALREE